LVADYFSCEPLCYAAEQQCDENESENAGFTTGTPWLQDPSKLPGRLSLNKRWQIPIRSSTTIKGSFGCAQQYSVVVYGKYDLILESHKEIYAFTRTLLDERLLVILNFSPRNLRLPNFVQRDNSLG
jgi:alpha-glucosidase